MVKRHAQGICSARREQRNGLRLQVAGSNPRGRDGAKVAQNWRLGFQAPVDSGSSGRSKSSREQAPAYYASMRHSANRRETVEALH